MISPQIQRRTLVMIANPSNDSDASSISSSSSDHSVPDEVKGRDVLEEIINVAADTNP